MIATPINKKGEPTGESRHFTPQDFEKLKSCFKRGAFFPWKVKEGETTLKEKDLMVSTKDAKPKEKINAPAADINADFGKKKE